MANFKTGKVYCFIILHYNWHKDFEVDQFLIQITAIFYKKNKVQIYSWQYTLAHMIGGAALCTTRAITAETIQFIC